MVKCFSRLKRGVFRHYRLCRTQSINGRAHDAAGVARTLADRIQPFYARRLARRIVARDAHRGAAAQFRPDQRRLG